MLTRSFLPFLLLAWLFAGQSAWAQGTPLLAVSAYQSFGANYNSLQWTAVSGATSYKVYRGTTSGGEGATPLANSVSPTIPMTFYSDPPNAGPGGPQLPARTTYY